MVSTNTTKIHVTVPFLWNSLLGKYGMQGISWKLETFVMHSDVVYNRIQDSRKWNWNERLVPDCQVSLMWWQEFWIVLGSKESLDFTLKQWGDSKTVSRKWRKLFLPQTIRQSGSRELFSPSKKCHVIKNDLMIIWAIWSQLLCNSALFVFSEANPLLAGISPMTLTQCWEHWQICR